MPQSYKVESNDRFTKNLDVFVSKLQKNTYSQGIKEIHDFCLENNAIATLSTPQSSINFGSIDAFQKESNNINNSSQSMSYLIRFKDTNMLFTLSILQHLKIVNEITQIFYQLLPLIILLILFISAVSSWICSRVLSKPVLELSTIANKMTQLDMTWHCDVKRQDELGVLTTSLNTMAAKLSETMKDLETANQQLRLDIDKERAQEKQRRDFFAAASHELKTPITIAKGQIESMIYGIGDYKDTAKYLPQTLDTINRMEGLVKEILVVSKLHAQDLSLKKEQVHINKLITSCLQLYAPMIHEKKQYLHLHLKDVVCNIDPTLFKKVISNLINNANKYAPTHATIQITLDNTCLRIENSGVHIDEGELQNVFRPLYRLEQSRNSSTGGSGLGLYIVESIIKLHNYTCTIENSLEGVVFTIYF